jgi:hypothetical protein
MKPMSSFAGNKLLLDLQMGGSQNPGPLRNYPLPDCYEIHKYLLFAIVASVAAAKFVAS